jgi:hypothetical protein
MDELKFVFRCFLFATGIVLLSQVKMNNETLESKAEFFLQESKTAHYLQQSAAGGVHFLNQSLTQIQSYLKQKMAHAGGSNEPTDSNSNF